MHKTRSFTLLNNLNNYCCITFIDKEPWVSENLKQCIRSYKTCRFQIFVYKIARLAFRLFGLTFESQGIRQFLGIPETTPVVGYKNLNIKLKFWQEILKSLVCW